MRGNRFVSFAHFDMGKMSRHVNLQAIAIHVHLCVGTETVGSDKSPSAWATCIDGAILFRARVGRIPCPRFFTASMFPPIVSISAGVAA